MSSGSNTNRGDPDPIVILLEQVNNMTRLLEEQNQRLVSLEQSRTTGNQPEPVTGEGSHAGRVGATVGGVLPPPREDPATGGGTYVTAATVGQASTAAQQEFCRSAMGVRDLATM